MLIKGQRVIIDFPDNQKDHKQYKYNRKLGFVYSIECKWNPIPIVKLDDGSKIPIEKKFLKHLKQETLFSYG